MENIEITLETILAILGIVVTAGAAQAVFSRWLSPYKKLKEDVKNKVSKAENDALKTELDALKVKFEQLERYQDIDHDRLKDLEKGNEVICKCMLALTDHELTGKGFDKLQKAKEEMQNYLIERK